MFILIAILLAVLIHLGIIKPSLLLPDKCSLQQKLYCKDYIISAGSDWVVLKVHNAGTKGMLITLVNAESSGGSIFCENNTLTDRFGYTGPTPTRAGRKGLYIGRDSVVDIFIPCTGIDEQLIKEGKKKLDLTIQWYSADSTETFTSTMRGKLITRIEP
jgi:hypothetical protein